MGKMIAILTEEVAKGLISRGFELKGFKRGRYATAYYFEDSVEVERMIAKLMADLDKGKN